MVALKEYELSVNLESISFQIKKENVDEWYKLTRSYFEHETFSIYEERKVNRDLCNQFKAKHETSGEYYVFNFFLSGRILINTKRNRKELLENRIPDLEKQYKIVFKIKGAKFNAETNETLNETTTSSRTETPTMINKEGEKDVTSNNSIDKKSVENTDSIQENKLISAHEDNNKDDNQNLNSTNSNVYNTENSNDRKITVVNRENSQDHQSTRTPVVFKNYTNQPDFQRTIIVPQSKSQKDFMETIEKEQIKLTEELGKISETIHRKFQTEYTKIRTEFQNVFESMKREILVLKNHIKTVTDENVNLKSQIKTFDENVSKRKGQNNSNEPYYNELKESIECMKKYNTEFSNTTNNDIIQIENNIKSIEQELKQQKNRINESFKAAEKTENLVRELNGTIEGILDNGNPWMTVGKNGKKVKISESLQEHREEEQPKNRENFELLILGDSITKYVIPSVIAKCHESQALNYSIGGSKVRGAYDQIRRFHAEHENANVNTIILHIGTNHLPRDKPEDTARKICKLMNHIRKEFPQTRILYSAILPKFNRSFNSIINYVNNEIFEFCMLDKQMSFIQHNTFAVNHNLNSRLYSKDNLHPNNLGLRQLAKDIIEQVRIKSSF